MILSHPAEMELRAILVPDEGNVATVYDDKTGHMIVPGCTVHGHPTIGIGRALDTNGISADEAEYLFDNDLERVTLGLSQDFTGFDVLDEPRQLALICMAFQLGVAGTMAFKAMLGALEKKDWVTASHQALNSDWAKQTPVRAKQVASILLSGKLPSTA